MATYTAQILIGIEHQNHSGLLPFSFQQMLLAENDTPYWSLFDTSGAKMIATWVPEKPETILEDAFLAVAYYVVREEWVVSLIGRHVAKNELANVNLGKLLSPDDLEKMRAACRKSHFESDHRTKLIVVAFEGSTIIQQLTAISKYSFDCEVITPKFYRCFSVWEDKVIERGLLSGILPSEA
jgi:hypothetical protein